MAIFTINTTTLSKNLLIMKKYFTTSIGRLRLYAFLEGISLLSLVFIAVPFKYFMNDPGYVRAIGPVHGALFLLFIINALRAGVEQNWKSATVARVVAACFIPFGTFYIDRQILRKMSSAESL